MRELPAGCVIWVMGTFRLFLIRATCTPETAVVSLTRVYTQGVQLALRPVSFYSKQKTASLSLVRLCSRSLLHPRAPPVTLPARFPTHSSPCPHAGQGGHALPSISLAAAAVDARQPARRRATNCQQLPYPMPV